MMHAGGKIDFASSQAAKYRRDAAYAVQARNILFANSWPGGSLPAA